jgi:glutamate synthase (NADPH/NADH) large chain
LRGLVEAHAEATDSKWSQGILEDWHRTIGHFWQVVPKEMLTRLSHPLDDTVEAVAAE